MGVSVCQLDVLFLWVRACLNVFRIAVFPRSFLVGAASGDADDGYDAGAARPRSSPRARASSRASRCPSRAVFPSLGRAPAGQGGGAAALEAGGAGRNGGATCSSLRVSVTVIHARNFFIL